jgi:Zn finger protein HypA/HybF involved in hydrogenase expression
MYLWCDYNKLNATALNTMFETVHSNTIPNESKITRIDHNPGANSCDRSIATSKGWTVRDSR